MNEVKVAFAIERLPAAGKRRSNRQGWHEEKDSAMHFGVLEITHDNETSIRTVLCCCFFR